MANNTNKLTFNPITGLLDEISVFTPPNGTATLVAGTITVLTANVTTDSEIFLTGQGTGGTAGELSITNRVAGVSFDILSTSATDTRKVAWLIYEPASSVAPSQGLWLSLGLNNMP